MKTFKIQISASDIDDILQAIDNVREHIEKEYLSGSGSNEFSQYKFESTGEYKEKEQAK